MNVPVAIQFTGPRGPKGRGSGFDYVFSNVTMDADPGSGKVRANDVSLATATQLFISNLDAYGNDQSNTILTWDDSANTPRGILTISRATDNVQTIFQVTGFVTSATGYKKVTVAYQSGATAFAANDPLSLTYSRSGDRGTTGVPGSPGTQGLRGFPGSSVSAIDAIKVVENQDDFVPPQQSMVWALVDVLGRVIMYVTKTGDVTIAGTEFRRDQTLGDLDLVRGITDSAGHVVWGIKRSNGRVFQLTDTLPPSLLTSPVGTVANLRKWMVGLYRYDAICHDCTWPQITRPTMQSQIYPLHMIDVDPQVEVMLFYGQSWASELITPANIDVGAWTNFKTDYGLSEPNKVFGFGRPPARRSAWPIGVPGEFQDTTFDEFFPIRAEEPDNTKGGGMNPFRMAAVGLQRLRLRHNIPTRPMIAHGAPFPSSTWAELKPGGSPDGGVSHPWAAQQTIIDRTPGLLARYYKTPIYRGYFIKHGASTTALLGHPYYDDLVEWRTEMRNLNLNGVGGAQPHFFLDQESLPTNRTEMHEGYQGQIDFGINFADVSMVGTASPYPFRDGIHHTDYGYAKLAEIYAIAAFHVLDLGMSKWTPLSYVNGSLAVVGNQMSFTTTDPLSTGKLAFDTDTIEAAPDFGLLLRINGVIRTLSNIALTGLVVSFNYSGAPAIATDTVNLRYAWENVGGTVPDGTHGNAWGNIKQKGDGWPSVFWRDQTIDPFLISFEKTVVLT